MKVDYKQFFSSVQFHVFHERMASNLLLISVHALSILYCKHKKFFEHYVLGNEKAKQQFLTQDNPNKLSTTYKVCLAIPYSFVFCAFILTISHLAWQKIKFIPHPSSKASILVWFLSSAICSYVEIKDIIKS